MHEPILLTQHGAEWSTNEGEGVASRFGCFEDALGYAEHRAKWQGCEIHIVVKRGVVGRVIPAPSAEERYQAPPSVRSGYVGRRTQRRNEFHRRQMAGEGDTEQS